jgi:hypothetical protein
MSKEMVVTYFKELSEHFSGRTWKSQSGSIRIVNILAEVRTGHLPNTSEKRYRLNQLPRYMKFKSNVIEFFIGHLTTLSVSIIE